MRSQARRDELVVAYARWVIRWRWPVLLAVALAAGAAISGGRYTQFIASYKYHFGPENPQLAAFIDLENTYTRNDNLLFVVAPTEGDVFQPEALDAVLWLTEQGWQLPYSIRVDSISNFQHTWADEDDLIVEDLVEDTEGLGPEELDRIRDVALAEPLLRGKLVAPDAKATGVNVTIQLPESGGEIEATAAALAMVAELRERHPALRIALTGTVALSNAFETSAQGDIARLVPLMGLALVVAMVVFLHSLSATVVTLLVTVLATATGMGLSGWLGIPITAISANAPTIILTIAIANGVHILVTMTKEQERGLEHNDALVESLRLNWQPVFLCSLTTIIGFMSLNSSDIPSFHDLGNMTALGVASAWVYSVTLLPALTSLLPHPVKTRRARGGPSMERFAEWLIVHRRGVLASCVAAIVVSVALIPRIEINDMFVRYFDPAMEFRQDTDFTSANLTGIYMVHFSVGAGEDQGVSEPGYLERLQGFATWLREQPEVSHVSTLSDTMKRLNKNLHGDDESYYRLPENRELAAQYLLLYEMSLPYGLDLNNQIDISKSSTKVTATLYEISTREMLAFTARAEAWLRDHTPEAMHTHGSGLTTMFSNLAYRNVVSMLGGTGMAFGLIALILMLSLQSLRLGLLSLVPNIVPTVFAFGVWALLSGVVGMSVGTVVASSLGIIVDATVHFLSKYLRARREQDASSEDAVRYALSTVGSALWITFLILIAGFTVLSLSTFKMNADFGLLVAITIACALVADFLLLPTLLMRLDRRRSASRA